MKLSEYEEIQPLLHKAESIVLCVSCLDDSHRDEIEGALWAAHDLIKEAKAKLSRFVGGGK